MDQTSLENMRQTGRWLNHIIALNRKRFVFRGIETLKITRDEGYASKNTYNVVVSHRSCRMNLNPNTPLFLWMAQTFRNCSIKNLILNGFCFDSEDLEGVEEAIVDSRMRIEYLELNLTYFTDKGGILT